jgi:hypothetical protein
LQARCIARLGFEVTATDVSPYLRGYRQDKGGPGGQFWKHQIRHGQYSDDRFAGTCYTLMEQWMQEQYCRNIHRLLAPAGWLLIKDNADSDEIRSLESLLRYPAIVPWPLCAGTGNEGPFFVMKPLHRN